MAGQRFLHLSPFAIALLVTIGFLLGAALKVPPLRLLILVATGVAGAAPWPPPDAAGRDCAPILLAPALAKAWPARRQQPSPCSPPWPSRLSLLVLIARLALPVARGDDPVTPVSALAHVPRFVRETPVLNDYGFGGYLIWNGVKPFIDSRADLYGDIFLQNYAAITSPDKDALAATLAYLSCALDDFPRRGSRW